MEGIGRVIDAYFNGMADIIGFMTAKPEAFIILIPLGMIGLIMYSIPLIFLGAGAFAGVEWIIKEVRNK